MPRPRFTSKVNAELQAAVTALQVQPQLAAAFPRLQQFAAQMGSWVHAQGGVTKPRRVKSVRSRKKRSVRRRRRRTLVPDWQRLVPAPR